MKATAFSILPLISRADATEGGQAVTDVAATYTRNGLIVCTTLKTAGTNPTCDVKIQNSPALAVTHSLQNTAASTTADLPSRNDTDTNIKLAAKFVVPTGGVTVSKVWIPLKKAGAPTGTITVTIYADTAGDPSGSALATFSTLDAATLTTSYVDTLFSLTLPTDLAAGTYHLILESDVTISTTAYVAWHGNTVSSGGNANLFGTGWVPTATKNLQYRLHSYVFTDVTGAAFTQATTTATMQAKEVRFQDLAVIRPFITITGSSNPAYTVGVYGIAETAQS
jgi:hypothetical protein